LNAAVVCPGPSAAHVTAGLLTGYDWRIAVNRAVLMPFDWSYWAATDDRIPATYRPAVVPRLFTMQESVRKLAVNRVLPDDVLSRAVLYETVKRDMPGGWALFTMTAAMVLGAWLGAKRIDVYGYDGQGTADYDGHEYQFKDEEAAVTRTPQRWEITAGCYRQTVAMLAARGVEVRRIDGLR
jgi:hypothetical protein